MASVYQPLALARVRASAIGDTRTAGGRAERENAPCAPRLLPLPSAWWYTPAVTTRTLGPHPEAARTARRFTRDVLASWGLDALADEAEAIIGELVVNAITHGTREDRGHHAPGPGTGQAGTRGSHGLRRDGTPLRAFRVCLLRRAGEVMLAALDPNDDAPAPRQPGWEGESGRGLQIVQALSDVWGWSPMEGHGKAVWAVLRCP